MNGTQGIGANCCCEEPPYNALCYEFPEKLTLITSQGTCELTEAVIIIDVGRYWYGCFESGGITIVASMFCKTTGPPLNQSEITIYLAWTVYGFSDSEHPTVLDINYTPTNQRRYLGSYRDHNNVDHYGACMTADQIREYWGIEANGDITCEMSGGSGCNMADSVHASAIIKSYKKPINLELKTVDAGRSWLFSSPGETLRLKE